MASAMNAKLYILRWAKGGDFVFVVCVGEKAEPIYVFNCYVVDSTNLRPIKESMI